LDKVAGIIELISMSFLLYMNPIIFVNMVLGANKSMWYYNKIEVNRCVNPRRVEILEDLVKDKNYSSCFREDGEKLYSDLTIHDGM